MQKVERVALPPMQRDRGGPGAQEWERLQKRVSHVGEMLHAMDQALDHAAALVSPLLDAPHCPEVPPALAQAWRLYEETVAVVTGMRQQLFDLPMLLTLLAHAPSEERAAVLRQRAQPLQGCAAMAEALDAAATHVVQTWRETRSAEEGQETRRGCAAPSAGDPRRASFSGTRDDMRQR